MKIDGIGPFLADVLHKVDKATPDGVRPRQASVAPSSVARWAIVTFIVAMAAIFSLVAYVVVRIFDKIIFGQPLPVVLAQFKTQLWVAMALIALLGASFVALIKLVANLAFSGSVSLTGASFQTGPADGIVPAPPQTTTVAITSPANSDVVVDAPPPASVTPETGDVVDPTAGVTFDEGPPLPVPGYPSKYGD